MLALERACDFSVDVGVDVSVAVAVMPLAPAWRLDMVQDHVVPVG